MKHQDYLDLIEELNAQIEDNKYTENLGMAFTYSTSGYISSIDFGHFNLYNTENDSLSKFDYLVDDWVDISLREFIITKWNILKEELFNIELQ